MDDNLQIVNDLIDKIIAGDNLAAKETFDSAISAKMQDAIDLKKAEVAQSIYNTTPEPEDVSGEEETEIEFEPETIDTEEQPEPEVTEEPQQDEQE